MYQLLSDTPQREDRLGFAPMAEILTDVIRTTPPPFTVGVFGEWGSGKTTLMTLVRDRLEAQGVKTAWFNAWKYDGKEVIWNALIQTVFLAMREEAKTREDEEFLKRILVAASRLATFAARKLTQVVSGGAISAETIDQVTEALRPLKADDETFAFINTFETTFADLVREYVGQDGRLVVFVDDLDRCLPENAVEVLEAIKLYLDSANVTFVIGVEPEVVRMGIRHRYRENSALANKEYLEKIIQLPFVMRGLDRTAAKGLIEPYAKTEQYVLDDLVIAMILHATEANPRRIKRFINTFYVLARMHVAAGEEMQRDDIRRLALVLLTQMRFREIAQDLVAAPGLIAEFNAAMQEPSATRGDLMARNQALMRIFENASARDFFDLVRDLDSSERVMRKWVLLTRGEPPTS